MVTERKIEERKKVPLIHFSLSLHDYMVFDERAFDAEAAVVDDRPYRKGLQFVVLRSEGRDSMYLYHEAKKQEQIFEDLKKKKISGKVLATGHINATYGDRPSKQLALNHTGRETEEEIRIAREYKDTFLWQKLSNNFEFV